MARGVNQSALKRFNTHQGAVEAEKSTRKERYGQPLAVTRNGPNGQPHTAAKMPDWSIIAQMMCVAKIA